MNWRSHSNKFENCDIALSKNDDGMVLVDGVLKNIYKRYKSIIGDTYVKYWAPNCQCVANDVSGVVVPFPNEEIAFEDTINQGVVKVLNDKFRINLYRPQSYYSNTSQEAIAPNVKFMFCDSQMRPFSSVYMVQV